MSINCKFIILLLVLQGSSLIGQGTYQFQPDIEARAVKRLHQGQLLFKDLNKNNVLDDYED